MDKHLGLPTAVVKYNILDKYYKERCLSDNQAFIIITILPPQSN